MNIYPSTHTTALAVIFAQDFAPRAISEGPTGLPVGLHACSVCFFGAPDELVNISLRAGMGCLLMILTLILGAFAKFFLGVRKRSRPDL